MSFDTDTLKTAGIITGVTLGVALVIVLIIGVVRDTKRHGDDEEENDDVWSQSPVLRTLGYRPADDPLLGKWLASPEGPSREGRTDEQEIEAFLEGKIVRVSSDAPYGVPTEFSLWNPEARRGKRPPPFSLRQEASRPHRTEAETGRSPGTT